jgi:hypothetical protein
MTNLTTTLNAKELKSILKLESVKVISCKKGNGSLSDCVNLVISSVDLRNSMLIMSSLNIVNNKGNEFNYNHYKTNRDYVQFHNCKKIAF